MRVAIGLVFAFLLYLVTIVICLSDIRQSRTTPE